MSSNLKNHYHKNESGKSAPIADGNQSWRLWILFGLLAIGFAWSFMTIAPFDGLPTSSDRRLTDAEKCEGLSHLQCWEKLEIERKRQEWLDSPEGRDWQRAAEATRR